MLSKRTENFTIIITDGKLFQVPQKNIFCKVLFKFKYFANTSILNSGQVYVVLSSQQPAADKRMLKCFIDCFILFHFILCL